METGNIGNSHKTSELVMTAMTMCLIMVAIFMLRVPIPFTQGYLNLSDAIIFLGVMVLGWKNGGVAAALGSTLGDILGGFAMWAPWTFVIKGGMAAIAGIIICASMKRWKLRGGRGLLLEIIAMAAGGVFMVLGYYVAEGVMYGSWTVAALGTPWNAAQSAVGIALAITLQISLSKTSFRKFFKYKNSSQ